MGKLRTFIAKHRDDLIKLFKYGLTGGTAFLIELGGIALLTTVFGWDGVWANALVYSINFWIVFLVNKYATFQSRTNFKRQLFRYALLYLFNLGVTSGMMWLLTTVFGWHALLAKFPITLLVVCWNFFAYKYFIYVDDPDEAVEKSNPS